jgi:hypothetical protein
MLVDAFPETLSAARNNEEQQSQRRSVTSAQICKFYSLLFAKESPDLQSAESMVLAMVKVSFVFSLPERVLLTCC